MAAPQGAARLEFREETPPDVCRRKRPSDPFKVVQQRTAGKSQMRTCLFFLLIFCIFARFLDACGRIDQRNAYFLCRRLVFKSPLTSSRHRESPWISTACLPRAARHLAIAAEHCPGARQEHVGMRTAGSGRGSTKGKRRIKTDPRPCRPIVRSDGQVRKVSTGSARTTEIWPNRVGTESPTPPERRR